MRGPWIRFSPCTGSGGSRGWWLWSPWWQASWQVRWRVSSCIRCQVEPRACHTERLSCHWSAICKIYIDVYLMSKRSYSELFPCVCYHRVFKSAPLTSIFFVRSRANDAWNTRARNRALTGPNKNLQSILAACLYLVKKYNRVDQRVDRSVLVRECEYWSEISPACEGWRTVWWRHVMETLCTLLAFCGGNPLVTGWFPSQRLVMQNLDVFCDININKLSFADDQTHWGRDKMGDILQTTFSKPSSWKKIPLFHL